ncbi:phage tail tape measure protein [Tepidiphilus succinatimandens]|uniref:phage tail tape measure protein n=1 Tax=Tepidiphilus succinatimandens TaxID=224436 RepID=UPI00112F78B4|nr:phage tail tape measure protein [Tepidiphilus succinatimandens]
MSATLSIAAILTLKDQLSAPLRAAQSGVAALAARMKEAHGAAQKVSVALRGVADAARHVATLSAQAAAAGQLATGFGLESYARNALDVEHRLAALGNTANMSNGELNEMYDRIKQAARATNQFTSDLLAANEQLIAAGLEWRKALDITPIIGEVATASQAAVGDLAKTGYSIHTSMLVPLDQMRTAFERLIVAGQSGQFELKDMAREFDKLGVSMGVLKFTGLENVSRLGAALQIARRGAGDAAEAANNLQNFLVKLAAPEVQKNFAKFGIDLPRLLKTARERGLDPFLVTLKAVQKATGGDEFKLGELFGDMQVQNFIKPLLLYTDDYKKLVAEIDSANGVIEGNFTRMMGTTAERWKQFRIQLETTPMPWLDALIDRLSSMVQWMNQNEELAGRLATGLVALGAAAAVFGALSVTLSGVSAVVGGIGTLIAVLGRLRLAFAATTAAKVAFEIANSGAPLRALAFHAGAAATAIGGTLKTALLAAGRAILWLGRALLMNPIGLAITAIAGAAYLIWRNWDTVKAALAATWQWLQSAGQTVADALKWAFLNMTPVGQVIQHWDEIKAGAMAVVEWMSAIPSQIMQIGRDLIDGFINGIRERWQALKDGISSIASGIADTVRGMLGINSPSRVFAEIGGHLMDGLSQGIERTAGLPLAAMRSVATGLAVPIAAGGLMLGENSAFSVPQPVMTQPIVQMPQPVMTQPIVQMPQPAQASSPTAAPAAIQVTVNLNGPATPEAANDIAAAVRREVERALAESARRDALARRASMIDGGLA